MRSRTDSMRRSVLCAVSLLAGATVASAQSGARAYHALGLKPQDVLTGTVLHSKVLPGPDKQVVCIATYFTGKKDQAHAVNVRLGIFDGSGERLIERYRRDFGEERGGHVANGDLQLVDLDLDGVNEIVVSFDTFGDPLVRQRMAEVILHEGAGWRTAWADAVEYDATKAARSVAAERRDHFSREFDWSETIRTRGVTLFVVKKVFAVAGEPLGEPRTVRETFRLRDVRDG